MKDLPAPMRFAVIVAGIAAAGNLLLAIAHLGVTVPLLSAIGPQGGAVPAAVVGFTVTTVLFAAITVGLLRCNRGAWIAGLVVSGLAIASGVGQFRGAVTGLAIALSVVLIVLLLTPQSRRAVRT